MAPREKIKYYFLEFFRVPRKYAIYSPVYHKKTRLKKFCKGEECAYLLIIGLRVYIVMRTPITNNLLCALS